MLIEEEEAASFPFLPRLFFFPKRRPPPLPPPLPPLPPRTAASLTHAGSFSPSAAAWQPSRASESLTRAPWSSRSQLGSGDGGEGEGGGRGDFNSSSLFLAPPPSPAAPPALSPPAESASRRATAKQASPAPGEPVAAAAREAASGEEAISVFLGSSFFFPFSGLVGNSLDFKKKKKTAVLCRPPDPSSFDSPLDFRTFLDPGLRERADAPSRVGVLLLRLLVLELLVLCRDARRCRRRSVAAAAVAVAARSRRRRLCKSGGDDKQKKNGELRRDREGPRGAPTHGSSSGKKRESRRKVSGKGGNARGETEREKEKEKRKNEKKNSLDSQRKKTVAQREAKRAKREFQLATRENDARSPSLSPVITMDAPPPRRPPLLQSFLAALGGDAQEEHVKRVASEQHQWLDGAFASARAALAAFVDPSTCATLDEQGADGEEDATVFVAATTMAGDKVKKEGERQRERERKVLCIASFFFSVSFPSPVSFSCP